MSLRAGLLAPRFVGVHRGRWYRAMATGEMAGDRRPAPSSSPIALHYLGPPGTYSHQVASELAQRIRTSGRQRRPRADSSTPTDDIPVQLIPSSTITDTVRDARRLAAQASSSASTSVCALALLPYENNSNGPVVDAYDIVHGASSKDLAIVSDAFLSVRHSLLASAAVARKLRARRQESDRQNGDSDRIEPSDLSHLSVVSSHTQALGQCSTFLKRYCPTAEQVETSSTGDAARRLVAADGQEGNTDETESLQACIASSICAQDDVYGLVELASSIQNSNGNTTRFLLCQVWNAEADSPPLLDLARDPGRRPRGKTVTRVRVADEDSTVLSDVLQVVSSQRQAAGAQGIVLSLRKLDRKAHRRTDDAGQPEASTTDPARVGGHWSSSYVLEIEAWTASSVGAHDTPLTEEQEAGLIADCLHRLNEQLLSLSHGTEADEEPVSHLGTWFD